MTSPTGSTGTTESYTDIINDTLAQWGLSSLAPLVNSLGKTGAGADEINLKIQASPEYKARFAGNAARAAKGLGVLSPAQYIALEGQYRQIMDALPAGFHDSKAASDARIGNDVSPSELSQRVADANDDYINAPQSARDAFNYYHPHAGPGGAVAAILDTSTAEPILNQQLTAAGIGGAAVDQGLRLTGQATAMKAAQAGVTIEGARQAYSAIAQRLGTDRSTSGRFANGATGTFDQAGEEAATLLGSAGALQKQNLLYSEESAQFGGKGGAAGASGAAGNNY